MFLNSFSIRCSDEVWFNAGRTDIESENMTNWICNLELPIVTRAKSMAFAACVKTDEISRI